MNSLEEVLTLVRLRRERTFVSVDLTPPLFILVIVKSVKICFSEKVVSSSAEFSPPQYGAVGNWS